MKALLVIVLLIGAAASRLRAQSFGVDWFSIVPGGVSSNANYSVRGMITQTDGRMMAGGRYGVDSGFAGIVSIVQQPGAPTLCIARTGTNAVISWPAAFAGFILQRNQSNVNDSGSWADTGLPVVIANGTNTVTIPITGYAVFRLKR